MSDNKPREFWIDEDIEEPLSAWSVGRAPGGNYKNDFTHVIEYSAYEALEEKLRVAVEALEDAEWLEITIQKLLDENKNRDWIVESDVNKWASIRLMRNALAKIKGGK